MSRYVSDGVFLRRLRPTASTDGLAIRRRDWKIHQKHSSAGFRDSSARSKMFVGGVPKFGRNNSSAGPKKIVGEFWKINQTNSSAGSAKFVGEPCEIGGRNTQNYAAN